MISNICVVFVYLLIMLINNVILFAPLILLSINLNILNNKLF
jgi:hypothetical protein